MTFRMFSSLLLALLVSTAAIADAPPAYQPFEVKSANRQFMARVDVEDRHGKPYAWQWDYSLSVSKAESPSEPLWKTPYSFDGYAGGIVSEDGCCFAYASFWFYAQGPLLYLYTREGRKTYAAEDLGIKSGGLQRTASHWLWLKQGIRFWPNEGTPQKIIVDTVQGEKEIGL